MATRAALWWVPVLALAVLAAAWASPLHAPLALLLGDLRPPLAPRPALPEAALVVDIDEASLEALRPQLGTWPLSRDTHALVARWLHEAGARVVTFNLLFADAREGDAELAAELRERGPAVLAVTARSADADAPSDELPLARTRAQALPIEAPAHAWPGFTLPAETLLAPAAGAVRVGVVSTPLDADGRLRRLPLLHREGSVVLPALPVAALMATQPGAQLAWDAATSRLRLGRLAWPVDASSRVLLPSPGAKVPVLPFATVARAALGLEPGDALADRVRGRAVFIGSSAAAGTSVLTPHGQHGGTELLAQTYTALAAGAVQRPPGWPIALALLGVAWLPALATAWRGRAVLQRDATAAALAALGVLVLAGVAEAFAATRPSLLEPALLLATGLALAAVAHARQLARQQQQAALQRQLAEEASRAKSAFLANVSHEIRTPMNAVLGVAELLAETELDAEQRRHVEIFRRSGDALSALIDDLLDLSKIEAGRLELTPAPFALRVLLHDRVSLVRPQAERKGLQLVLRIGPDLPDVVLGDRLRLGQVLLNLMGNAVKFTRIGLITLEVGRDPQAAGRIRFCVRDTGPGIDAARLSAVFEPFTQADAGVAREHGGTGLGLAISRHLVQLMGGTLEVESTPGLGSAFSFSLALEAPAGLRPPVAAEVPAGGLPARGLAILLAEDHPTNVYLVQGMLKEGGHRLDVVSDGLKAVERFAAGRHDLVLLDMQLPGQDGLAAAREMRRLEAAQGRPRTPLVALTANAYPSDVAASLAAGCDVHLSKPVRKADLLATIAQLTQARAPAAAVPAAPRPAWLAPLAAAGVDVDTALGRLGGDERLYRSALGAATEVLEGWPGDFAQAWQSGARADALRLLHDLKGLAATLGAGALAQRAAALEKRVREGATEIGADQRTLQEESAALAALLKQLA